MATKRKDCTQIAFDVVQRATGETTAPAPGKKQKSGRKGVASAPMKEPPENGLTWTTYPEQLQAAGITWKVYGSVTTAAGGGSNMNEAFQTYRQANVNLAAYGAPTAPYTPASEAISPLYKGIGNTMPDGGFLAAMAADIAAGALPQVSWVHAPMRA